MGQPFHVKADTGKKMEEMRETKATGEGRESRKWPVSDAYSREKEQQMRRWLTFSLSGSIFSYIPRKVDCSEMLPHLHS